MSEEIQDCFQQFLRQVIRQAIQEFKLEMQVSSNCFRKRNTSNEREDRFLLRAGEAAKRLAISKRHLHKLTTEGQLPCVKIGRLVHYSVASIEKWISENESLYPVSVVPSKGTTAKEISEISSPEVSKPRKRETGSRRTKVRKFKTSTSNHLVSDSTNISRSQRNTEPCDYSPFEKLLREIHVDRDDVPRITNGELMTIAGVDKITLHGWQWLKRELPTEASDRLKAHFRQYQK